MRKIITLVFLFSSIAILQGQSLVGKWHFESITSKGENIVSIDTSDFFIINEDSSFTYTLKAKNNLIAKGFWHIQADTLQLNYTSPKDTTRYYTIVSQSDSAFVIAEDQVLYAFEKPQKINTSNVGAMPFDYDFGNASLSITSLGRGILGLTILVFLTFLMSSKRKKVNWPLVIKGLLIQVIFALGILKVPFVRAVFDWLSRKFVVLLNFTQAGSEFLFGGLITDTTSFGYIFAFQVLPTVIFFSALTSLLFYYGVLQKIVFAVAWIMKRTMKLSGAESLAAAGNVFLGQTESPLLVKPYIKKMTKSELLCLMSGGMATIAGGVLAAYIGFLGGDDIAQQVFFAKHLLAASVMSAPAAVVAAKILRPETEEINNSMKIEKSNIGTNALEAIANGTTEGLKLAVNVGAMLLVFIALMAMVNYVLQNFIGDITGLNDWVVNLTGGQYSGFSMQFILGYTLAPLTWLMGVANEDIVLVGQLLGEKTILNEFVAYVSLGDFIESGKFTSEKSIIISTYILCGFANFASIGIQIGGIGSLAPSRQGDLSKLGFQALIAGTLASLFTAVIVGMLI